MLFKERLSYRINSSYLSLLLSLPSHSHSFSPRSLFSRVFTYVFIKADKVLICACRSVCHCAVSVMPTHFDNLWVGKKKGLLFHSKGKADVTDAAVKHGYGNSVSVSLINPADRGQRHKKSACFAFLFRACSTRQQRQNAYVWNNARLWACTVHTFPPY